MCLAPLDTSPCYYTLVIILTALCTLESFQNLNIRLGIKVTVQGHGVALGRHFATLCQELDFYEANMIYIRIINRLYVKYSFWFKGNINCNCKCKLSSIKDYKMWFSYISALNRVLRRNFLGIKMLQWNESLRSFMSNFGSFLSPCSTLTERDVWK